MHSIPPAIIIGFLINASLAIAGIEHSQLPREIRTIRDVLLVLFFICVGLSLAFGKVRSVLGAVKWVVIATVVMIMGQNWGAIGIASLYGQPPQTGILLGSVSFVGGLGSAVAWGAVLEEQGMPYATSIGVAGALLGMVVGAIVAGPFGFFLLRRYRPESDLRTHSPGESDSHSEFERRPDPDVSAAPPTPRASSFVRASNILIGCVALAAAYAGGEVLQRALAPLQITLPRFLTAMLASVALIIVFPEAIKARWRSVVEPLEPWILNTFLVITFATLDYKELAGMGPQVAATAIFQVLYTVGIAWALVFLPLNRTALSDTPLQSAPHVQRAEAAATAAAVVGFGLSSLSVAMAVLRRMSSALHPLPQARQTIAVTGAGIVDLLNALSIGLTLWMVR